VTGPDDEQFCARVSQALEEGYELHGSPAVTHNGTNTIVAQALLLPSYAAPPIRQFSSTAAVPQPPSVVTDEEEPPVPTARTGSAPAPQPPVTEPPGGGAPQLT